MLSLININILSQKIELMEKRKFWYVKVLICKQIFHKKLLLNALYFFLISPQSTYISNEKYAKLRIIYLKWNNWIKLFSKKGSLFQ